MRTIPEVPFIMIENFLCHFSKVTILIKNQLMRNFRKKSK